MIKNRAFGEGGNKKPRTNKNQCLDKRNIPRLGIYIASLGMNIASLGI